MKKRRFTPAERYAIWHCHGAKCWLCPEPLRLEDTTIDHFFPESLLEDDARRKQALAVYGLGPEFDINSFSNWLPCHGRCNQGKASKTFRFVPGLVCILDDLIELAPQVARTARGVSSGVNKDKLFGRLFTALENKMITTGDLRKLLGKLVEEPAPAPAPKDIILLEGGYWIHQKDVAREGLCQCEQNACVDHTEKVYCYFRPDLPPWVIGTGLYRKCYDQIVECSRCGAQHKRGHVGKYGVCGRPFRDQQSRID